MPTQVQLRRGTTAQTAVFTGAAGEVTVDTNKNYLVLHDGTTAGGHPVSPLIFTQAAFDVANAAFSGETAASIHANAAFNHANGAYNLANTGSDVASSASLYANGSFIQANAAFLKANAAYDSQNVTGSYANSAYNEANTAYSAASNAYNFATDIDIKANSAYNKANSAGLYANGAFIQANAAFDLANNKFNSSGGTIGGDVSITGNSTPTTDNVYTLGSATYRWKDLYVGPGSVHVGNVILSQDSGKLSISGVTDIVLPSSSVPASTVLSDNANSASLYANSAFIKANAAFDAANNVAPQIEPAFNHANGAFLKANSAYDSQNTTGVYANAAYAQANSASLYANGAFTQSNAAFDKANSSIQNTGSNSINGSLTINNSGGTGLTVSGNVLFNDNLSITGNVYIGGNATSFGANNIVLEDSIIYVANNNSGNTIDIGIVGNFAEIPTGYQHTGVVRDHTDGTWKFFSNVIAEPTTTVDFTNAIYDPIKAGDITGTSATINGVNLLPYTQAAFLKANSAYDSQNTTGTYANSAFLHANSAFSHANSAYTKANNVVQTAFVTYSANSVSVSPTSNNDTLTISAATANGISITGNNSTKDIDFGLMPSGVTSGWYGGSTQIPSINVDLFGRITSIANNTVSTTISLAGGSGSGSVSGGGTLTISGGTGITTSVSSSTITVTNSGVTSFNGSTGSVTFGSINVTNALGYTPVNKAGDTMTGSLTTSGTVTVNNLVSNTDISIGSTNLSSNTYTTSGLTQVSIDSFPTTTYRTADYQVSITSSTSYHIMELSVLHDGTSVWMDQYSEMFTGSSLGTFDADILSGNLRLLFTPTNSSTTVKLFRKAIAV